MEQQWSVGRLAGVYLTALVFFAVVDLPWIGFIAGDLYASQLGELLAPKANGVAAAAFYLIYVGGLVYFAIAPALLVRSAGVAAVRGALLGLVSYATWDLTGLSVIRGFPAALALIDIAWGTFLSAVVSLLTVVLWIRLTRLRFQASPP